MKIKLTLFASFLFLLHCTEKPATFDGGAVTLNEIKEEVGNELYELKKEEIELKRQVARQIALDKILKKEAKKAGISAESLIQNQLKNISVSDKEAREFYLQQNLDGTFEQNKNQIISNLQEQKKQMTITKYQSSLFDKYNLNINLKIPSAPIQKVNIGDDPIIGLKSAPVTIVEFSDFECFYCRQVQRTFSRLRAEYKNKVRWVFKDYPLSFHPQAMKAHIAVNCANNQNKFFEYQQILFNAPINGRKIDLTEKFLLNSAKKIGLNLKTFQGCLTDSNGEIKKEIQSDIEYGQKLGVRGTPSIFINGQMVGGAQPYKRFKEIVESQL